MVCIGVIGTWREDLYSSSNGEYKSFFKLVRIPNFDSEIEGRRQRGRFLIKSELFVRSAFDTEKRTQIGALQMYSILRQNHKDITIRRVVWYHMGYLHD